MNFRGGEIEEGGGARGKEAGGEVVEGFVDEGDAAGEFGGGEEEEGGEAGDEFVDGHVGEGLGEGGEGGLEDCAGISKLGVFFGGADEVPDAVFGEAFFVFPKEGEGFRGQFLLFFLFFFFLIFDFNLGGVLWGVVGEERG